MHALNVLFCMWVWVQVQVIRTLTHPNQADQTPAGLFCAALQHFSVSFPKEVWKR